MRKNSLSPKQRAELEAKRLEAAELDAATNIDYTTWQAVLSFLFLEGITIYPEKGVGGRYRIMVRWEDASGRERKKRGHEADFAEGEDLTSAIQVVAYRIITKNYDKRYYKKIGAYSGQN